MKVIDASVALKWFVREAVGQQAADRVLAEVENDPGSFAVPELFFAEMLHVLGKVFKNKEKVKESLLILENLGFERVGLGHELLELAAELSQRCKIGGYDAIYVACAQLLDGQWLTFDHQAHKKLAGFNLSKALS